MAIFDIHPSPGRAGAREHANHCAPDFTGRQQERRRVSAVAGTLVVVGARFPAQAPIGDAFHCVAAPRLEHCA